MKSAWTGNNAKKEEIGTHIILYRDRKSEP